MSRDLSPDASHDATAAPQPAVGGLHLGEWAAELVGTAVLVFGALSSVAIVFHPGSAFHQWIPSLSVRLLLLGLVFGAIIVGIATSPIGRLSGAHLNPVVTLAFWITGHVHPHDLLGYWAAQLAGGVLGTIALRVVWGKRAAGVDYGAITPEVSTAAAVAIEALMVALLIGAMFLFLSARTWVRWTPVAAGLVVAADTWLGSKLTNTGLNPARTLGPSIVSGHWQQWWVYFLGPAVGAALVAALWLLVPRIILTAKLFHDPRYRSVLRTHLPAAARHSSAKRPERAGAS